jgi:hypothetical protein
MAFIATWLRLSSNKQLTWYRKSARQGKDIAHSQKVLAQRMADKVSGARAFTLREVSPFPHASYGSEASSRKC